MGKGDIVLNQEDFETWRKSCLEEATVTRDTDTPKDKEIIGRSSLISLSSHTLVYQDFPLAKSNWKYESKQVKVIQSSAQCRAKSYRKWIGGNRMEINWFMDLTIKWSKQIKKLN